MKSLEQRAEVLEDCVEEISKVFLTFSDSMLKTQLIQKDPVIGRNLLSTTSKIVELAKIAGANSHTDSSSGQEEEDRSSKSQKESILHLKTPPPLLIDNSECRSKDISHFYNLYGNGWFGYEPPAMTDARNGNQDLNVPPSGFGLKLITQSLQVAYFALLDETGIYDTLLAQMYRYAFLYHTREEILANLRWFLEHGLPAQRYLGRAVFGFDTTLSLQHLNIGHVYPGFKLRILHPLVDAQALLDADYSCPCPVAPFLNAFDVEEHLVAQGAFHIDDEIIYMQTSKTNDAEHLPSVRGEDIPILSTTQRGQNGPVMSANLAEIGISHWATAGTFKKPRALQPKSITSVPSNKPPSHGKHCEMFDFNALLKDRNDQSIMEEVIVQEQKPRPSSKIINLSVPLLIDNLVRNSVCLGTGPGYPRNSIEVAIEASTRPSTTTL
jgi:hypothetical protein